MEGCLWFRNLISRLSKTFSKSEKPSHISPLRDFQTRFFSLSLDTAVNRWAALYQHRNIIFCLMPLTK